MAPLPLGYHRSPGPGCQPSSAPPQLPSSSFRAAPVSAQSRPPLRIQLHPSAQAFSPATSATSPPVPCSSITDGSVWFSSDSVSSTQHQPRHLWKEQTTQQYLLSTYCMPALSQLGNKVVTMTKVQALPGRGKCESPNHMKWVNGPPSTLQLSDHTHPIQCSWLPPPQHQLLRTTHTSTPLFPSAAASSSRPIW